MRSGFRPGIGLVPLLELAASTTEPQSWVEAIQTLQRRPPRTRDGRVRPRLRTSFLPTASRCSPTMISRTGRPVRLPETTSDREVERLKDEFLGQRLPRAPHAPPSILGYAEALNAGDLAARLPSSSEFVSVIERNANRLTRLVDACS